MMTNNSLSALASEQIRASANGYSFLLYDTSWTLDRNITINLADIHYYLPDGSLDGCLRTLAFYASNRSSSHTKKIFLNGFSTCCERLAREKLLILY